MLTLAPVFKKSIKDRLCAIFRASVVEPLQPDSFSIGNPEHLVVGRAPLRCPQVQGLAFVEVKPEGVLLCLASGYLVPIVIGAPKPHPPLAGSRLASASDILRSSTQAIHRSDFIQRPWERTCAEHLCSIALAHGAIRHRRSGVTRGGWRRLRTWAHLPLAGKSGETAHNPMVAVTR